MPRLFIVTWRDGRSGQTSEIHHYAQNIREAFNHFMIASRDVDKCIHFVGIRAATSIASFTLII